MCVSVCVCVLSSFTKFSWFSRINFWWMVLVWWAFVFQLFFVAKISEREERGIRQIYRCMLQKVEAEVAGFCGPRSVWMDVPGFRPSATVSRGGLIKSCTCHCCGRGGCPSPPPTTTPLPRTTPPNLGGTPPLPPPDPDPLTLTWDPPTTQPENFRP